MKRPIIIFLCAVLFLSLFPASAFAANNSRSYDFALSVNGKTDINATTGQIITLTLVLSRTDSTDPSLMHAAQAELLYDDTFFELVEGSVMTAPGIEWTDMARRTGGRAFYLNYVSFLGGSEWPSRVQLGMFQLRVKGSSGSSTIKSENCLVSVQDGTDSFSSTDNDVTVAVIGSGNGGNGNSGSTSAGSGIPTGSGVSGGNTPPQKEPTVAPPATGDRSAFFPLSLTLSALLVSVLIRRRRKN